MKDIGIYIHVPFCERKCLYCDFYSLTTTELIDGYVEELLTEIKKNAGKHLDKRVKTIYFGGGTPSLLSLDHLDNIINTISKFFLIDPVEITIEVNPNSSQNIPYYPSVGINRLSVGVQSADDFILKKLGRLHDSAQALNTLDVAGGYFDNISADLIIGVDEKQDVIADLDKILPKVTHLSSYILKVEDGTPLKTLIEGKSVSIATEDTTVLQYDKMYDTCAKYGLYRYEVSNFARLGKESVHNLSYWKMVDYLGFGPSAHSYVDGVRYYNSHSLADYLKGQHSGFDMQVPERFFSVKDDMTEYVMLAFRTTAGLDLKEFRLRYDVDYLDLHASDVKKMGEYLLVNDDRIAIRPEFLLVQNSIIRELL